MNTYYKYCPNVFIAKCENEYKKGDIIEVETKRGKKNESIVFNLIFQKNGFFYYSIIRADGTNLNSVAAKKSEKFQNWSIAAEKKSDQFYERSKKNSEFLSLGEPIKIGHHSEKRHRKLIESNFAAMGKSIALRDKAAAHEDRAAYYASKETEINLSLPDCIDFYQYKYETAVQYHTDMKSGKIERGHSYSLTYAKKAVNEAKSNLDYAVKLWGEVEAIEPAPETAPEPAAEVEAIEPAPAAKVEAIEPTAEKKPKKAKKEKKAAKVEEVETAVINEPFEEEVIEEIIISEKSFINRKLKRLKFSTRHQDLKSEKHNN